MVFSDKKNQKKKPESWSNDAQIETTGLTTALSKEIQSSMRLVFIYLPQESIDTNFNFPGVQKMQITPDHPNYTKHHVTKAFYCGQFTAHLCNNHAVLSPL